MLEVTPTEKAFALEKDLLKVGDDIEKAFPENKTPCMFRFAGNTQGVLCF